VITPKLRPNERLVLWALVLRLVVFAIPFIIFCVLAWTKWVLRNCFIILDYCSDYIENSVVGKYAHRFPSTVAVKKPLIKP